MPILETLKVYLSHDDVMKSILQCKNGGLSHLHDFTDSELFKGNNYFRGDRNLLRIILYCDELEICNPLGSAKGKYKLLIRFLLSSRKYFCQTLG